MFIPPFYASFVYAPFIYAPFNSSFMVHFMLQISRMVNSFMLQISRILPFYASFIYAPFNSSCLLHSLRNVHFGLNIVVST